MTNIVLFAKFVILGIAGDNYALKLHAREHSGGSI